MSKRTKINVWPHVHKCKVCDDEYTISEVTRKYGAGFPFGYCSPQCYTEDRTEKKGNEK